MITTLRNLETNLALKTADSNYFWLEWGVKLIEYTFLSTFRSSKAFLIIILSDFDTYTDLLIIPITKLIYIIYYPININDSFSAFPANIPPTKSQMGNILGAIKIWKHWKASNALFLL